MANSPPGKRTKKTGFRRLVIISSTLFSPFLFSFCSYSLPLSVSADLRCMDEKHCAWHQGCDAHTKGQ